MLSLSPTQQRILGALIEKHMTTPEHYPLTTKALVAACNQISNRDPVVAYDEDTVIDAVNELRGYNAARSIKRSGERAVKHLELADEVFEINRKQKALLGVMILRGPQTLMELRTRTERYIAFDGVGDVEATLGAMMSADNATVTRLERQPGHKERRYQHLVGDSQLSATSEPAEVEAPASSASGGLSDQVATLREEVVTLREEVEELRGLQESEAEFSE